MRFFGCGASRTLKILLNRKDITRPAPAGREVIVVGGSAAGLFTAAKVARGGRPVRVLDSKLELEPAARTLIVTDHFRSQLGSSAQESIVNEIRRFELFTDGRTAQVALHKPDSVSYTHLTLPTIYSV